MKKVYQYLLLAGLVVLAAACENEIAIDNGDEGSEQQMITETISANILGETKATVDANAKFAWTVGDNIAVHVSNGKYVFTSGTGGASEAAASASFTVSYPSGTSRDAFAIFPSTIVAANATNYGQSEHSLDVTLPASYALDEVSGTATPCPMIATNTPGSGWTFSQLCGLLRLTLNNLPPSTKSVTIDFNGKKVQGSFAIAAPVTLETAQIETSDTEETDDIITINTPDISAWTDNCVVNIPLPVGTYTNITVTSWDGADGTGNRTLTMTRPMKVKTGAAAGPDTWTATRGHGLKVTASLPAFSVADNVRIHIAKSNLQLSRPDKSKTWEEYQTLGQLTWSFLPEAWSMIFKKGETVSLEYAEETAITHFGWGATGHNFNAGIENPDEYIYGKYYQPWNTTYEAHTTYGPKGAVSLTGDFALGDWGVKACTEDLQALNDGFGAFTTWRIPTSAEYLFLFGMTANQTDATAESDTRYTKRLHKWGIGYIQINETEKINGMFVLPDNYVDITGVFIEGNTNISATGTRNLFTLEQWSLMEKAGVAFYPAAGLRSGRTTAYDYQTQFVAGFNYHSSAAPTPSSSANKAFSISGNWNAAEVSPGGSSTSRTVGCTVRLIREL